MNNFEKIKAMDIDEMARWLYIFSLEPILDENKIKQQLESEARE